MYRIHEHYYFYRLLNAGLDHIVFMVMLVALIIKYVLFESQGQLEESLIHDSLITPQDTLDNSRINNKGQEKDSILKRHFVILPTKKVQLGVFFVCFSFVNSYIHRKERIKKYIFPYFPVCSQGA